MKRRTVLAFALLLAMAVSGGALAQDVKLTWAFWYGDPVAMEKDLRILAEFTRQYPHIEVEPLGVPIVTGINDYLTLITSLALAGDLPDVFWVQPSMLGGMVERGLVLDITEMVARDELWQERSAELIPFADRIAKYHGRQYGFPRDVATEFFVYNKHAFEEGGLPYPNEMREQGSWIWETFEDVGRKLTVMGNSGRPTRFLAENYNWWSAVRQAGGAVFADDGSHLLLNRPESRQGLEWLQNLTRSSLLPSPGEPAAWVAQESVFSMAGVWSFTYFNSVAQFEWDMVQLPAGVAGPLFAGDEGLGLINAVGAQTKHPEEAYLLARYFADRTAQSIQVEEGNAFPIYRDLVWEYIAAPGMPEHIHEILEYYPSLVVTDKPPQFLEIRSVMDRYVYQIIADQIPVTQGVETILTETSGMFERR